MKQILISVIMLAIALALVIGELVPVFKHGSDTGSIAVTRGKAISDKFVNFIN